MTGSKAKQLGHWANASNGTSQNLSSTDKATSPNASPQNRTSCHGRLDPRITSENKQKPGANAQAFLLLNSPSPPGAEAVIGATFCHQGKHGCPSFDNASVVHHHDDIGIRQSSIDGGDNKRLGPTFHQAIHPLHHLLCP